MAGAASHGGPDGDHVTLKEGDTAWLRSPCLGLCDQAPAALLTVAGPEPVERLFGNLDAAKATRILAGDFSPTTEPRLRLPQAGDPSLRLLRRVDVADPGSLDAYRAHGGYEALRTRDRPRTRGRDS